MSPPRRPYADSQFGLWKSTNSVGNINTAKSPLHRKTKSNLLADKKGSQQGYPECIFLSIDLVFKLYQWQLVPTKQVLLCRNIN